MFELGFLNVIRGANLGHLLIEGTDR